MPPVFWRQGMHTPSSHSLQDSSSRMPKAPAARPSPLRNRPRRLAHADQRTAQWPGQPPTGFDAAPICASAHSPSEATPFGAPVRQGLTQRFAQRACRPFDRVHLCAHSAIGATHFGARKARPDPGALPSAPFERSVASARPPFARLSASCHGLDQTHPQALPPLML